MQYAGGYPNQRPQQQTSRPMASPLGQPKQQPTSGLLPSQSGPQIGGVQLTNPLAFGGMMPTNPHMQRFLGIDPNAYGAAAHNLFTQPSGSPWPIPQGGASPGMNLSSLLGRAMGMGGGMGMRGPYG